jgi:hypothetical protein
MRCTFPAVITIVVITLLLLLILPLHFMSVQEQQSASAQICRTIDSKAQCIEQGSKDLAQASTTSTEPTSEQQQQDHSQTQPPALPFISNDNNKEHETDPQSGHSHASKDIQGKIPSVLSPDIPFP